MIDASRSFSCTNARELKMFIYLFIMSYLPRSAPMNSDSLCGGRCRRRRLCVGTCVRACVRACVHACVYARVRVCMRDVFAIYDKIFDPG